MLNTLDDVRTEIDNIDENLIKLLSKRQALVVQAGHLKPKNNPQAVAAPERVKAVIEKRKAQAIENKLSPEVAEAVWSAMITAFIQLETQVNKE